jgi:fumarate hydratase, class II
MQQSLMLVTVLVPVIGYDQASAIAKVTRANGTPLRREALRLGHVTPEEFDRLVRSDTMAFSSRSNGIVFPDSGIVLPL